MRNNKIKLVFLFILYFALFLIFDVLVLHYRSFRGEHPYTFPEIFEDFWVDILFCSSNDIQITRLID